jgi:hypothetical protein
VSRLPQQPLAPHGRQAIKEQRAAARRRASEGIQQLLDAGMSAAYVAEAYAAAGVHLLLEQQSYEDARDLLTALWMHLDRHEEHARHDHAST